MPNNNPPDILPVSDTTLPFTYTPTTPNTKFQSHTPSPVYGLRQGFDISDLPGRGAPIAIPSLAAVTGTTTSATLTLGAKSLELEMTFSTVGASCQIDVYTSLDSFTTPVFTKTVYQSAPDSTYVGNTEGINLNGYDVKIKVSAISAGSVTVAYRKTA